MDFWINSDLQTLDFSIVEEINEMTGKEHPLMTSPACLPFIFKELKSKLWKWHIESFDTSYVMVIYPGPDDERCFAQDIDLFRTVYLAYYDALIYEKNQ